MDHPYVALDLEFPSDIQQIERVVEKVSSVCRTLQLPVRQCSLNVPVALSEALANAILRGNLEDHAKCVRLKTLVSDSAIVFEVRDEGPGFDLIADTNDPNDRTNLQREDGRGLYLMQRLMDRVEQFWDHGNVVRLTLDRPAPS